MKRDRLLRALRRSETPPPVSRRRFIGTGLGSLAVGAVVGRQLLRPQAVYAAGSDPIPVPGSPNLAPFHVWAPAAPGFDPPDAEPATITNFNGMVGLAYLSGKVTRTNLSSGAVDYLDFTDADMRFMQGVYRGEDGKPRQGTFALI